jgi:S1-C subfamily serine protease
MKSFRPNRSDIIAGLSLVIALLAFLWATAPAPQPEPATAEQPSAPNKTMSSAQAVDAAPGSALSLEELSQTSARIVAAASRSVVRVEHASQRRVAPADDLEVYFGKLPSESIGSGIVVDASGLVLTNYHVIRGAQEIQVRGADHVLHVAQLVGFDPLTDLALLRAAQLKLPALEWGSSREVVSGQLAWAIGSPYGLDLSVTLGIISSTNRPTLLDSPFQDFLQTDAAINPGSSGGPLIDARGRLIGINTAIAGDQFAGIGFALPSDTAQPIVDQLLSTGSVPRGWIGAQLGKVSPARAAMAGTESNAGAYIESLSAGSNTPAVQAGLRVSDICVGFNGQPVSGPLGLIRLIAAHPVGTIAKLDVVRNGQVLAVDVQVAVRP